mmetsp:Transcript_114194/g.368945  ORF Transcript_114194/g.368945 Transcript_114194/m.368945 type:complete len:255 (+) Transcript_114194:186-950(+)
MDSETGWFRQLRIVCLAAATAPGAHAWTFCEISRMTPGNSETSLTTRCTRPISMAVCMFAFSAVQKSRFALAVPMLRITWGEITAGMTPSFTSESVACAVRTATTMSQAATRPTPPPMAEPFMQQIVNCGRWAHSRMVRARPLPLSEAPLPARTFGMKPEISEGRGTGMPSSSSACGASSPARSPTMPRAVAPASACACWNALGSPPAQNMRPMPVNTTMRTSGRPRRMSAASWRPAATPSFTALLASGRLRVQ